MNRHRGSSWVAVMLLEIARVSLNTALATPEPDPRGLEAAIEAAPAMGIARAYLADAAATARIEVASPRPWLARGGAQNRSVTGEAGLVGQPVYGEWDVGLEHEWRLPGKHRLDRAVGAAQVARAAAGVDEARRTVTVELLEDWYRCVAAQARTRRANEARDTAAQLSAALRTRHDAGETSQLELDLAASESASLAAEAVMAAEELEAAGRLLSARALPASCAGANLDGPPPAVARAAASADRDPAVRVATAAADLAAAQAERAHADRIPDPTVGVRYAEERGGLERIAGVYFSVPLPGGRMAAEADHAAALARIAQAERRRTELWTRNRIDAQMGRLRAARAQWLALDEAANTQSGAAARVWNGYLLGEVELATALQARRAARAARAMADDALIQLWHAESLVRTDALAAAAPAPVSDGP